MVSVEDCGDKNGKNDETRKLGAEIVGIFAIIVAIVEGPKKGRGDGDFDVFPDGLIYRGKKADGAMLSGEIIKKMRKSTHGGDGDNANPHDEGVVHGYIIT